MTEYARSADLVHRRRNIHACAAKRSHLEIGFARELKVSVPAAWGGAELSTLPSSGGNWKAEQHIRTLQVCVRRQST
jgi:hypothetical protein